MTGDEDSLQFIERIWLMCSDSIGGGKPSLGDLEKSVPEIPPNTEGNSFL